MGYNLPEYCNIMVHNLPATAEITAGSKMMLSFSLVLLAALEMSVVSEISHFYQSSSKCVHVCMCVCVCLCIWVCVCVCFECACVYMYMCVRVWLEACARLRVCACEGVYIYARVHVKNAFRESTSGGVYVPCIFTRMPGKLSKATQVFVAVLQQLLASTN